MSKMFLRMHTLYPPMLYTRLRSIMDSFYPSRPALPVMAIITVWKWSENRQFCLSFYRNSYPTQCFYYIQVDNLHDWCLTCIFADWWCSSRGVCYTSSRIVWPFPALATVKSDTRVSRCQGKVEGPIWFSVIPTWPHAGAIRFSTLLHSEKRSTCLSSRQGCKWHPHSWI